ncbi:MAG: prepilin-type N-terminal cleavage/methylation domain-containing protein [Oscillospiraceae bacterium]|nr:prepilin-type N-terminal cleavage/methylation domain-containing protein [Oscillospiraceae bacterium]
MNMFKKNGGFTLVELIVVIAILAVLAGVAIPVYSGYIKKADEAADYTQLDSIKTAAVFAAADQEKDFDIDEIVYEEGKTVATVDGKSVNIKDYVGESGVTLNTGSKATWSADTEKWLIS